MSDEDQHRLVHDHANVRIYKRCSHVAPTPEHLRRVREWDLRLALRHMETLSKDAQAQILNGMWPACLPKKASLIAHERDQKKQKDKLAEKSKSASKGGELVAA